MKNVLRCLGLNLSFNCNNSKVCQLSCYKYSTAAAYETTQKTNIKDKHPYKKIHDWKSFKHFSKSLVKNIIYNENGLVVLNKPYGISSRLRHENDTKPRYQDQSLNAISGAVDYSLANALPYIADKLGYKNLTIVKSPEKFMSGVTILAADDKIEKKIIKAYNRALGLNIIPKTYWIVTTRLPNKTSGSENLVMKLHKSPCKKFERPVIQNKWSKAQVKSGEVKILKVEYKVLSNSTDNRSALIEIKSTTTRWHAIRLFAATSLYSPVLGDNIHGSRIQNIMGTWMRINPFLNSVDMPPKINDKLLKLLNVSTAMKDIIPVHIHLKRLELPWYLGHEKNLVFEAPLSPEFSWTCQALDFELPEEVNSNSEDSNPEEQQIVQISQ